jgi:glc operon protein GlcG
MNRKLHFMRSICRHILEEAVIKGFDMTVCALDIDGRPMVTLRDDRSPFMALDPARGKAMAALMLRMPTAGAVPMMAGDPVIARAMDAIEGLVIVPGGMPVFMDGEMIGAVGVSGGHYRDDHEICEKVVLAAVEANKTEMAA